MKKILVVDASAAVRETIHLILGTDFAVVQKSSPEAVDFNDRAVDLLIFGVSADLDEAADLSDIARRSYSPILFLVDSQFSAAAAPQLRGIDYLVKPFNPYQLKEKVAGLLRERPTEGDRAAVLSSDRLRSLDPPFLPRDISQLARQYAATPFSLLIVAEAGCGQEAIARAVHALGHPSAVWLSVHATEAGRLGERLEAVRNPDAPVTLYVRDVDTLHIAAQSSFLDYLLAEDARQHELRVISNARSDLLEKVYRGEFLDALYYRLATLYLVIPPLRDRPADIPLIADRLAEECSQRLNLKKVQFSPAALERLRNYLWFSNLEELEAVVSRTLAIHRKELIDAPDVFLAEIPPEAGSKAVKPPETSKRSVRPVERNAHAGSAWNNGHSHELKLLIGELAHELKNPMVTVKTFSQLLGDRFDDPAFRVRFQQTVNGDIQRMDDLLDALISFSHFGPPEKEKISVYEQLKRIEEELLPECIKRETALQWTNPSDRATSFVDKAQFSFALKNILRAAAAQVKPKTEIQVDVTDGGVAVSYIRETASIGAPADSDAATPVGQEEALPLRLLLANILLERNGGAVKVDHIGGDRSRISAELPAEQLKGAP
jgi:DNA-binding NtrC family response regulator